MGQPHGTVAALVEPVVANAARKGSRMRTDRWWQSLVVAVVWVAAASGKGLLWVEGEGAARRSVIANAGLDAVDPEELSGGAWLSSFANGDQATGTAFFEVVVPESGVHQLWGRGMGNLACRLDDGEWMVADPKRYSDHLSIAADGNHGYPTVGWFDFGEIELTAGKHRFAWRLGVETGEKRFGTLDCFVLAAEAFQPNGKWKPGEAPSPEPAFLPGQAWDFAPSKDTFDSASLLDLRNLNEEVAGQHGFVRLAADGESFLRGDGQPIRFWAVGLRTRCAGACASWPSAASISCGSLRCCRPTSRGRPPRMSTNANWTACSASSPPARSPASTRSSADTGAPIRSDKRAGI
jgi:hypothetical protein